MSKRDPTYMDIGHRPTGYTLWLYGHNGLETAPTGTHESVWGVDAMNFWRGRYDHDTGLCSAVPPDWWMIGSLPSLVRDALESEFGGGIDFVQFNPGKAIGQRLRRHRRCP